MSFIDNFSLTRDRHIIKMGVEVRRVFTNPGSSADGSLSFTNRDTFMQNQLDTASVTTALPLKKLRKTQTFSFVQDEYKVSTNLTLMLGLRYQFFGVFSEKYGRAVPFDFETAPLSAVRPGGVPDERQQQYVSRTPDYGAAEL